MKAEDILAGAIVAGVVGYVLRQEFATKPATKQIPAVPLDDMLTEDAIMRRLDGNTLTPIRPFDYTFWDKEMGWKK